MHKYEAADPLVSTASRSFRKEHIFGTWNVQGLTKKKDKILLEIQKEDVDVIVLTETKLKGTGKEEDGNYIHIRSGVNEQDHARAGVSILIKKDLADINLVDWKPVNERIITAELSIHGQLVTIIGVYWIDNTKKPDVKNSFAGDFMNELKKGLEKEHELIILGDFNSKVGTSSSKKLQRIQKKYGTNFNEIVGSFGDEEVSGNGETLLIFCKCFGLKIQNTFFDHKDCEKYTRYNKQETSRSIIDYCITRLETKLVVHDVLVCPLLDCGSDHKFLKATISFKIVSEGEVEKDYGIDTDLIEMLENVLTFN